ncbi:MAG: DNA-directed RNA polymerase subunit A' [Candidatus Burarchaeum sp.]|nr:DNA-directed RNA polymerase subunit A' [Candidatus Burarchaeum sp.]MDO8339506.1 DNA-directed RNA polymerase subunit A' [Candidatus Burarchaeum sp.]
MSEFVEKMVDRIKFSLFSPEMVRKISAAKITVPDTYNEDGYPIDGGLVDQRMGVIDPGLKCKTCGGRTRTCSGHFTHIELVRPVVHPEFSRIIYMLLRSTCVKCGKMLTKKKHMTLGALAKGKKGGSCPHCEAKQAELKFEKPTTFYEGEKTLLPTEIRDRLSKIPDEELRLMGYDPDYARPEWMILTALLVPPVTVRPSITLETGERSEDDLTHKLVDTMRINQRLEANINAGAPQLIIEDLWELLQYHVTTYFNNETTNIPPARHRSGRPLKTLSQRLKGKEGRFRYNLSGKRVNFSARTVISPDPNISINDVGVPRMMAEELTVPVRVTEWNIEECKKLIDAIDYPHAVYVIRPDGKRRKVTDKTKEEIQTTLAAGFIVERQLMNGDTVLFNRQPSLHRMSMMCHNVKVLDGRTFRINLPVCPPYNADFDGDEMNLHVPQTEEARVEAEMLMKVENQIISPRHGHAIIKPQEDHVSGIYYLTKKDSVFSYEKACQILALAGIYELPASDVHGGKYSGKLLFSQLLPKDFNMRVRSKLCRCEGQCGKEKCPYDGYIVVKDGLLTHGTIESKAFENEIIEVLVRNYGAPVARKFIDDATRMALYVITKHGFSADLSNYTLSKEAAVEVDEANDNARKDVMRLVSQYKKGLLERMPGRTLQETLEEKVMARLSRVRNECGKIVENSMGIENTSILMARIGARGSILNAIQMAATVGQQAVREKRLSRGYRGRALIHFRKTDRGADARGFVASSFVRGLTPEEFFFHSMGGRESLVNTAIRTARSGYMQRRLINALQDLVVKRDLSVRDSKNIVVEYTYGSDGKDPQRAGKGEATEETERE